MPQFRVFCDTTSHIVEADSAESAIRAAYVAEGLDVDAGGFIPGTKAVEIVCEPAPGMTDTGEAYDFS